MNKVKAAGISAVRNVPLVFVLAAEATGAHAQIDVAAMGDELSTGLGTFVTLAIQVISAIVFLVVGYGVVSKFIEAIGGRAAWGEVVMPVLVGAFVLVACAYFFTQATDLAAAIGT